MPTNYSDTTAFPDISAELARLGSQIGAYNQDTYNKYYTSVSGKALGGGYCYGVTLDWVRRVLLSPLTRNRAFLSYYHEDIESGARTGSGAVAKANATVLRMGRAYAENPAQWLAPRGATSSTRRTNLTIDQGDWDAGMSYLDSTRPTAKKTFASLTVLSSNSSDYSSSNAWRGVLLGGPANAGPMANGCAVRVGFLVPGDTGHAIAIWRRRENTNQPDSFYMFDPNYGVFSYDAVNLDRAVSILFAHTATGDIPHYKDCGSRTLTRMSYMVFGPPNPADAIAVPTTVTAPVTATVHTPPVTPTSNPGSRRSSASSTTVPVISPLTSSPPMSSPPMSSPPMSSPPMSSPPISSPPTSLYSTGTRSVPPVANNRAAVTTSGPSSTTAGKHADLISTLEDLLRTGKPADEWSGFSYKDDGGVLLVREPVKKSVIAVQPPLTTVTTYKGGMFLAKGVQSGLTVSQVNQIIAELKRRG